MFSLLRFESEYLCLVAWIAVGFALKLTLRSNYPVKHLRLTVACCIIEIPSTPPNSILHAPKQHLKVWFWMARGSAL